MKKKDKRIAHAEMVWEREQIQAATAVEQLDKSLAIIDAYVDELSPDQIESIKAQVEVQREEIKKFLLGARDKYVKKMGELNLEVVIAERTGLDLSKARSLTLEVE